MHQKGGSPTSGASGGLPGLARTYLSRRYMILFYTLLVTMVAAPVFNALEFNGTLIESLLAACLLAAILPVGAVRNRPSAWSSWIWLSRGDQFGKHVLSEVALGIWTYWALAAGRITLHPAAPVDAGSFAALALICRRTT
jgi:hypothetical protein